MVTEAVKSCPQLAGVSYRIYAKGSYANNTNVRRDSDVDVAVDCHECLYSDYHSKVTTPAPSSSGVYTGPWKPEVWRAVIVEAMKAKFGASSIDVSGKIAIDVAEVPGSRPSIDVVPGFRFRRYYSADHTVYEDGACVFPRGSVTKTINFPDQQLRNGRKKNDDTGKRYKNYVRALKNAENHLAKSGVIEGKPSYLMECLIWNVADVTLRSGDLDEGFRATLTALWNGLKEGGGYQSWLEPNRLKWAFSPQSKWTVADAREVVLQTWRLLGYS